MRTTCIKDNVVEGKAALEKNERQAGNVLQRNAVTACKRMIGREKRHNRFAPHILPLEAVFNRQKRSRKFHISGKQQFLQPPAAVLDQLNVDFRIKLRISRKDGSEKHAGPDGRQAEFQQAALEAAELTQLGQHVVFFRQHGDRATKDNLTCRCEAGGRDFTIQQNQPQFVFKLSDRLADGRLGRVDGFCGGGKTALPHHFDKGLEAAQVHEPFYYGIAAMKSIHF